MQFSNVALDSQFRVALAEPAQHAPQSHDRFIRGREVDLFALSGEPAQFHVDLQRQIVQRLPAPIEDDQPLKVGHVAKSIAAAVQQRREEPLRCNALIACTEERRRHHGAMDVLQRQESKQAEQLAEHRPGAATGTPWTFHNGQATEPCARPGWPAHGLGQLLQGWADPGANMALGEIQLPWQRTNVQVAGLCQPLNKGAWEGVYTPSQAEITRRSAWMPS